jgi:hypothetical protein
VVELLLTKDTSISQETSCFDANERQGAKGWEELTGRAYTQKSNIAIVLDNIVFGTGSIWTNSG